MGKQIRGHLHVTFQGLFCYQAILAGAILTGNPPMKPKLINSAHMTDQWLRAGSSRLQQPTENEGLHMPCAIS